MLYIESLYKIHRGEFSFKATRCAEIFCKNVICVRKTEILVAHVPPQGVSVSDYAGLVIKSSDQEILSH